MPCGAVPVFTFCDVHQTCSRSWEFDVSSRALSDEELPSENAYKEGSSSANRKHANSELEKHDSEYQTTQIRELGNANSRKHKCGFGNWKAWIRERIRENRMESADLENRAADSETPKFSESTLTRYHPSPPTPPVHTPPPTPPTHTPHPHPPPHPSPTHTHTPTLPWFPDSGSCLNRVFPESHETSLLLRFPESHKASFLSRVAQLPEPKVPGSCFPESWFTELHVVV